MAETTLTCVVWALTLGAVSAVSLPLGSLVGLNIRFKEHYIAILAAFGAGALIAALAPTAFALTEPGHADSGWLRGSYLLAIGILPCGMDAVHGAAGFRTQYGAAKQRVHRRRGRVVT